MSANPIFGAEAELAFVDFVDEIGFEKAATYLLQRASPEQRAMLARMMQRAPKGPDSARGGTSSSAPSPQLSEDELAEFYAHAKAHPWVGHSGISPSQHIKTVFGKWLGRGLALAHITKAQKNLSAAYSTEVSRKPETKIESLIVKSHRLDSPIERSKSTRLACELSPEELDERRTRNRASQARWRAKHAGL